MRCVRILVGREHENTLHQVRAKLLLLAGLGVEVQRHVDDIGELLERCRYARENLDLDTRGGYEADDPKSDGYHDRMADIYDMRDGK